MDLIFLIIISIIIITSIRIWYILKHSEDNAQTYDNNIKDTIFPTHDTELPTATPCKNNIQTKNIKEIKKSNPYSVIQNNFGFNHNMNCHNYSASAIFSQTNRKRTVKKPAFNEDEIRQYMLDSGFLEPIEIEEIPFPPATEAQINAIMEHQHHVPQNICKDDASAIISKSMDNDATPNPELFTYATEQKIMVSYYTGKKALYNIIFYHLELDDKIAFFAFCLYRFYSDDRNSNLNHSPYKDIFYEYAKQMHENPSFLNSLKRMNGEDLRYWGKIKVNGRVYTGTSTNTIVYRETYNYLKKENLIH